ncbi:hypothetical protein B0O99DRAFT_597448 [Bisporella sp. PMI_857]|nr:hypothetical protein B0O99DRAFT_597448 [Bisporella sp. PMI_857]
MYKWHAHSAIGRGRPIAHDLARVTDGIAASLRQFSISAKAAEDEKPRFTITRTATDVPARSPSSRGERSQAAVNEISSLAPRPPPRGIDARSLAAKPKPGGFTISRLDETGQRHTFSPEAGVRRFNPNFSASRGGMQRGGARGGALRGGARGRARRGGRMESRRGPREAESDEVDEFEETGIPRPYTESELQWRRHMEGGYADGPYESATTLEALQLQGAPVLSSPQGLLSNITHKLRTGTGTLSGYRHANEHRAQILRGTGVSAFYTSEDAKEARKYLKHRTTGGKNKRVDLVQLSEEDKEKLSKAFAAGHYVKPETTPLDDVLGQVKRYTLMNETVLPEQARKLEDKIRSLLPAQYLKGAPKQKSLS